MMVSYKLGALLALAFCVTIFSTTTSAAAISQKEEHQVFFKQLGKRDQQALMELAIAHHDVPDQGETQNGTSIFPITPMLKPRAEEIPSSLFTSMLNGKVPKKWMKEFITWLNTELRIPNSSLNDYRRNPTTNELCTVDKLCFKLTDIGSQCCPFG